MAEKNKSYDLSGFFDIFMAILAFISIGNVLLAYFKVISLTKQPFFFIQIAIEIIYIVVIAAGFLTSRHKGKFFSNNLFDIISIIPFHPFFILFRVVQFYRVIVHYKLIYRLHLSTPLTRKVHEFLFNRGFVYLISASIGTIIVASLGYSIAEHVSLSESIWWAIVTATTVGYGDISPKTGMGKMIAIVLMIFGIGFIGLLTTNLIQFITSQTKVNEEDDISALNHKLDILLDKVDHQEKEIKRLRRAIKGKHPKTEHSKKKKREK